jgi:hypothetical protein
MEKEAALINGNIADFVIEYRIHASQKHRQSGKNASEILKIGKGALGVPAESKSPLEQYPAAVDRTCSAGAVKRNSRQKNG